MIEDDLVVKVDKVETEKEVDVVFWILQKRLDSLPLILPLQRKMMSRET